MNFRKYTSLLRAGIMESLHFRMSALVLFFGNLVYIAIIFYLWKAIYASSPTDVVNGMTFTDTLIYVVLASSLFFFMEMYAVWEIGRSIQSGKIVLDLLKPIKYKSYLFWSYSGELLRNFFCVFLHLFEHLSLYLCSISLKYFPCFSDVFHVFIAVLTICARCFTVFDMVF